MSFSIKSTALGFLALAASTAAKPVTLQARAGDPATFQQDMINGHNFYRDQHGAAPVTWNDDGARYSQDKANSCIWGHQNPIDGFGENIFTGGFGSWFDVSNGWGQERLQYDFNNPGFNDQTGHFTQMVWQGTNSIGCAWNDCGDNGGDASRAYGIYVVCKYAPPGNYLGDFQNNVLPQVKGQPTDLAQ